jgi:hypothetical protein
LRRGNKNLIPPPRKRGRGLGGGVYPSVAFFFQIGITN